MFLQVKYIISVPFAAPNDWFPQHNSTASLLIDILKYFFEKLLWVTFYDKVMFLQCNYTNKYNYMYLL